MKASKLFRLQPTGNVERWPYLKGNLKLGALPCSRHELATQIKRKSLQQDKKSVVIKIEGENKDS